MKTIIRHMGLGALMSLALAMIVTAAQPIVLGPDLMKSLVAYWSFNEGAGEEAQDASARGHVGRLLNGPIWVPGAVGQALRFVDPDAHVLVPYHPDFDLAQGFSIVVWAYLESDPDTGPGNDWRLLVGRNGFRPYGIALEQNGKLTGSIYVGGERRSLQSETEIPLNEWIHVVFTYEAASGRMRLYLGGELEGEQEAPPGEVEAIEGRPMTISLPKSEALEEFRAWPGRLDEVQIYNRALGPDEVQALYRGTPHDS